MAIASPPTQRQEQQDLLDFLNRHELVLRALIRRTISDFPNDVDDVLQDAVINMLADFHNWPADDGQRLANAKRLAKNRGIDFAKKRRGQNWNRTELSFDPATVDRPADDDAHDGGFHRQLRSLLSDHPDLDSDAAYEFERRKAAFYALIDGGVLKDIERQVLLEHHPEGADRNGAQVAKRLNISHDQARQHYHFALKKLKPLMAHHLAPTLAQDEAQRTLDWLAGGPFKADKSVDTRARTHWTHHVKHCPACQDFAEAQRAVIGVGVKVILPLPLLAGVAKMATASALTGGGVAAGVELAGTSGLTAGIGSGALGGIATKAAATIAVTAAAAGGVVAVKSAPDKPQPYRKDRTAQRTPQPTPVATATPPPLITPATAPAGQRPAIVQAVRDAREAAREERVARAKRRAQRERARARREQQAAQSDPLAIPTITPTTTGSGSGSTTPSGSNPAAVPTAAPPTTGIDPVEPPADKPNSNFSNEFTP